MHYSLLVTHTLPDTIWLAAVGSLAGDGVQTPAGRMMGSPLVAAGLLERNLQPDGIEKKCTDHLLAPVSGIKGRGPRLGFGAHEARE